MSSDDHRSPTKELAEKIRRVRQARVRDQEKRKITKEFAGRTQTSLARDEATAIASGTLDTENERLRVETQGLRERNSDLKINRKLRWQYAKNVFCYLVCYSIFVAFLLLLSGCEKVGFKLSEKVLIFLVSSTAVSAIGLVLAVTNGLFGKHTDR